jgi:predicted nucleic acid-binding protein
MGRERDRAAARACEAGGLMALVVVLDAGALIAFERGRPLVREYVLLAARGAITVATSSAVVAQVWRGGARQARLARLLRSEVLEEVALDQLASRRIGALAATTGATDVVDGHVALIAEDRDAIVVTSDASDLSRWGVARERMVAC